MSEIRAVYLDRRIRQAEPTRGSARCAVADEIRWIMESCSESSGFGSLTIRGADDVEIVLNLMAALRLLYESREPWPEEPLVVVIPEGSLPKLMSVKDYEEHGMPEGPPDPDEDPTTPRGRSSGAPK